MAEFELVGIIIVGFQVNVRFHTIILYGVCITVTKLHFIGLVKRMDQYKSIELM